MWAARAGSPTRSSTHHACHQRVARSSRQGWRGGRCPAAVRTWRGAGRGRRRCESGRHSVDIDHAPGPSSSAFLSLPAGGTPSRLRAACFGHACTHRWQAQHAPTERQLSPRPHSNSPPSYNLTLCGADGQGAGATGSLGGGQELVEGAGASCHGCCALHEGWARVMLDLWRPAA